MYIRIFIGRFLIALMATVSTSGVAGSEFWGDFAASKNTPAAISGAYTALSWENKIIAESTGQPYFCGGDRLRASDLSELLTAYDAINRSSVDERSNLPQLQLPTFIFEALTYAFPCADGQSSVPWPGTRLTWSQLENISPDEARTYIESVNYTWMFINGIREVRGVQATSCPRIVDMPGAAYLSIIREYIDTHKDPESVSDTELAFVFVLAMEAKFPCNME